jgi:hypothetical protein
MGRELFIGTEVSYCFDVVITKKDGERIEIRTAGFVNPEDVTNSYSYLKNTYEGIYNGNAELTLIRVTKIYETTSMEELRRLMPQQQPV